MVIIVHTISHAILWRTCHSTIAKNGSMVLAMPSDEAARAEYIKNGGDQADAANWLYWRPADKAEAEAISKIPLGNLSATVKDGQVVDISLAPGPDETFLHLTVTAPGSGPTGVPSVAMDETAVINVELRAGRDPESAVVPYTGTVRAPYRMNGAYHGELRIELEAGLCLYTFAPQSHQHGKLTIDENDIGLLQDKKIRLVGVAELIVDQKSAA